MLKFRYFILGLGIIILGSSQGFLYAQEYTIQTYKPTEDSPYVSKKECIDRFDFDKIDPRRYSLVKDNLNLLTDYFRCRAVVDEAGTYNLLKSMKLEIQQVLVAPYSSLQFWTSLIKEIRISPQMVKNCKDNLGLPMDECRDFIKAFMAGDESFCETDRSCKGYVTLNEDLVNSGKKKEKIYYLKALKNLDIKECKKIKDKLFKKACEAYITQDKKICEQDEGFKKFQDIYCSEIIQVEEGREVRYKLE